MWHASVSFRSPRSGRVCRAALQKALKGVGIDSLQWVEEGNGGIWHCRRRMTTAEQKLVGAPIDIRGTMEHRSRANAMASLFNVNFETAMEWG